MKAFFLINLFAFICLSSFAQYEGGSGDGYGKTGIAFQLGEPTLKPASVEVGLSWQNDTWTTILK